MPIILYLCLLLTSGVPVFLFAAPPPGSAADAAQLETRPWCDETYEGNGALRALLDPLYSESASEHCSTYISAPPVVTITVTATEESPITFVMTHSAEAPTPTSSVPHERYTTTTTVTATEWLNRTTTTYHKYYTNYRSSEHLIEKRAEPTASFVSEYPASQISAACSCVLSPLTSTTTRTPHAIRLRFTTLNATPLPEFETETVTVSTTVTQTTTKTVIHEDPIPTLCDPKNFKSYQSASDTRKGELVTVLLSTKEECCLTCYNAKNCIFFFTVSNSDTQGSPLCHYRIITEDNGINLQESPIDFSVSALQRYDLCPLGTEAGSSMVWPGSELGAEYGPCLDYAPLAGDEDSG